ncbi:MAG: SOS response-associated peptidase [Pedobacter sp.]
MCARYTLTAEEKEVLKENAYTIVGEYKPDPNIAITDFGFVVTADEPNVVQRMNFGIVPADAESKVPQFASFNIVSEEVLDKPTFAPLLLQGNTCLVIADGFYEAEEVTPSDKRPYRFLTERKLFCFAGLWTEWVDAGSGEIYRTYGIMTCAANTVVGEIHEARRMPVILPKNSEMMWLNKRLSAAEKLALCVPYPDHLMNRYRVSKKVNAVSTKEKPNKDLSLLKEVEDEPRQQSFFTEEQAPSRAKERKFKNTTKKGKGRKDQDQPPAPDLFNSQ